MSSISNAVGTHGCSLGLGYVALALNLVNITGLFYVTANSTAYNPQKLTKKQAAMLTRRDNRLTHYFVLFLDCRARGLNREDAMDRARWRKLIGMIDDYDESSG